MFRNSNVKNIDNRDRPRFLTKNEIERILSYIPELKCISEEARTR